MKDGGEEEVVCRRRVAMACDLVASAPFWAEAPIWAVGGWPGLLREDLDHAGDDMQLHTGLPSFMLPFMLGEESRRGGLQGFRIIAVVLGFQLASRR